MLKKLVAGLVLLGASFIGVSYYVSMLVVEGTRGDSTFVTADPAAALTFARTSEELILVAAHQGDAIMGTNLTALYGEAAAIKGLRSRISPSRSRSKERGIASPPTRSPRRERYEVDDWSSF